MATRQYYVPSDQTTTKRYASDLSDQEFALIAPYVAQPSGSGKKRTVDIREVLNALFYRVRTGYQWRMLPKEFPSWNHGWYYYRTWRNAGIWDTINTIFTATDPASGRSRERTKGGHARQSKRENNRNGW